MKAPSEEETWLERIGEKLGDFLAEPSAGQIIIRDPGGAPRPRGGLRLPGRIVGALHIAPQHGASCRPPAIF